VYIEIHVYHMPSHGAIVAYSGSVADGTAHCTLSFPLSFSRITKVLRQRFPN